MPANDPTRRTALLLAVLALAFLAQVVGQVIVVMTSPAWLPPVEEWYSGLVPYPVLLPSQIAILVLQWMISRDLWRGRGVFVRRAPRTGVALRWFAGVYFAVMVLRYVIAMALYPERRWFGHAIPIVFHWVLAAYLFVWSRYLTGVDTDD